MASENYCETIKQLKTKLHHSFLQISDLQQLHQEEIDSQKAQYQEKIKELTKQNEILKTMLKQQDTNNQKNIETIFQDIDDSFFQQRIKSDIQQNYADQTIQQLLNRYPLKGKLTDIQQLEIKIRNQCAFIPNELHIYFLSVKQLQKQNTRNKDDLLQLGKQYNRIAEQLEQSKALINQLRQRQNALKIAYQLLAQQNKRVKSELKALQNQKKHFLVKSWNNSEQPSRFSTTVHPHRDGQSTKTKQLQKLLMKRSLLHL